MPTTTFTVTLSGLRHEKNGFTGKATFDVFELAGAIPQQLTIPEAAAYANCSENTMAKWANKFGLKNPVGRIVRERLDALIKGGRNESKKQDGGRNR